MQIVFAYNVKHQRPSPKPSRQTDLEFDSPKVIAGIKGALEKLGHRVIPLEADLRAYSRLRRLKNIGDLVFNIAEGLSGDARESQIPLYCEMLDIPYTHSNPTVHAVALNKDLTKLALRGLGVKVPGGQVMGSETDKLDERLSFPLIIKPNREGSSKGVFDANVVKNRRQLRERLKFMFDNFDDGMLVEEFIEGRELTVALLGNGDKLRVLPIIEQKFDFLPNGLNRIAGFELKWVYEDALADLTVAYDCPAKLGRRLEKEVEETAKKIYLDLNVRDCARMDFRLNEKGELYFLELNTLPGLNLDTKIISYFPLAARTAGLSSTQIIGEILAAACQRWGIEIISS